jgi:hypothetical protein
MPAAHEGTTATSPPGITHEPANVASDFNDALAAVPNLH